MTEVARIRVNGVEVGSLPAEQYRQIHRQPYRDWEAYLSQLWVALDVCYRTLLYSFACLPVLVVFIIGISALAPGQLSEMADFFRTATSAEVERFVQISFAYSWALVAFGFVICCVLTGAMRQRLGCRNVFREHADYRVRQVLEVSAKGEVSVEFWPEPVEANSEVVAEAHPA